MCGKWCGLRWRAHNPCGSGLARENGGSVSIDFDVLASSRASPLPQGMCAGPRVFRFPHHPIISLTIRSCSMSSRCRASMREDSGKLVPARRLAKSSCWIA